MAVEHFFGLYTQQDGYEVESYFLVSANCSDLFCIIKIISSSSVIQIIYLV